MEETLGWALRRLNVALGPLAASSLYRTRPLSSARPADDPDYLNAAAAGFTFLAPDAALAVAKLLELRAGRELAPRDAPRPLDIDLLLYDDLVLDHPELTLPHPGLAERRFVLEPLADVAPERRVPPHGRRVRELLAAVAGQEGVERIGWSGGDPLRSRTGDA